MKKDINEVKPYLLKMLEKVDILTDGEKIKKNIERYYKNLENKEKSSKILTWKCAGINNYNEIEF